MTVHRIGEAHARRVHELLEELLEVSNEEGISSFMFFAESQGRRVKLEGVEGRLRDEPLRAIGWLAMLKDRMVTMAKRGSRPAD